MQGSWTNITNRANGKFSIFDHAGVTLASNVNSATTTTSADAKDHSLATIVEKSALINFFNDCNGPQWKQFTNWCSEKPVETWYGISIHSENGLVKAIRLTDNNLVAILENLVPHLLAFSKLEEICFPA